MAPGAFGTAVVRAAVLGMFGRARGTGCMRAAMAKHTSIASKRLAAMHASHAGCAAVRPLAGLPRDSTRISVPLAWWQAAAGWQAAALSPAYGR